MTNDPLVVERTYNASPARVWEAITSPAQMKEWYFDVPDFRAEVGNTFSFAGCGHDGEKYVHQCRVTEVIPERKLSYTWAYEQYDGSSEVSIELFPEGDGTRLKLTHTGLESFPARKDFSLNSFTEGWNEILGTSLTKYLEQ